MMKEKHLPLLATVVATTAIVTSRISYPTLTKAASTIAMTKVIGSAAIATGRVVVSGRFIERIHSTSSRVPTTADNGTSVPGHLDGCLLIGFV
jgi:hypothetical protein